MSFEPPATAVVPRGTLVALVAESPTAADTSVPIPEAPGFETGPAGFDPTVLVRTELFELPSRLASGVDPGLAVIPPTVDWWIPASLATDDAAIPTFSAPSLWTEVHIPTGLVSAVSKQDSIAMSEPIERADDDWSWIL